MYKKIAAIIDKGEEPTRADIAGLLASIGKPGKKQDEKQAAVRRLFSEGGYRATNSQNHHVADALESYETY